MVYMRSVFRQLLKIAESQYASLHRHVARWHSCLTKRHLEVLIQTTKTRYTCHFVD